MHLSRRTTILGLSSGMLVACAGGHNASVLAEPEDGRDAGVAFDSFDSAFGDLVDVDVTPRLLSTGHQWAEGPAWDALRQRLYFTDVPQNRAFAWDTKAGISIFLDPSGVSREQAGGMREPGANGLLIGQSGELLICNHGKRAVEAMDMESGTRRVLASSYSGKKFNSPNDLIEASDGKIYFTDPPYGLEGLNTSPMKELEFNGVYRLDTDGAVSLLVDDMTFPNGVILSPDERSLYVAQSDPDAPLIRRFDVPASASDRVGGGEIWFDAKPFMHADGGLPDGMAVATTGHLFLAGPGGVLVIDPQGQCLGRIGTGRATANCAFGEDGRTLFITAADRLVAVRTKALGLGRF